MFATIEAHQWSDNFHILDQMYRLRAKVFVDELGWDVSVRDGLERDAYDDCNPVYLVWTDKNRRNLYGSVRLLPTTGPTLLYDVFRATFPDDLCLVAPGIWEGTRLCVNSRLLARDFPHITTRKAFCIMLLALCETALAHHVHTLISNFEPPTRRLYRAAGAPLHEIGSSNEFGRRPVCAGLFPVSPSIRDRMREAIGVNLSLLAPYINDVLGSGLRPAA